MRTSDIFAECARLTGLNDEALNFSRISDAVECLANKGLIDAMQGYLEILTTSSRTVTLPRDVEVPVKVNVGDHPSFGRTKLYEFTMNGPGSNYIPVDWSWNDQGTVPILTPLVNATTLKAISNVADNSPPAPTAKRIYIWGMDVNNLEITESLDLNSITPPVTTQSFSSVTRVLKDVTLNSVSLVSVSGPLTLSVYAPDETEPSYRQIKISKSGQSCHILFRRSVYRISSQNDWIPVQSRMGLYCMLKANELYRKSDPASIQMGQALEKQAGEFVNEEQKSRNVFAEVASQTEKDSAKGIYFTNRDSIIVADIYDEVSEICGPIGELRVYDRISESVEALANKAQWDAMTAYLDIVVASGNIVTLPREVEVPLRVNINTHPSFSRDRLYEFTLNGPGPNMLETTDFTWMDKGNVPIIGLLATPSKITAYGLSTGDNILSNKVTIYGKDVNGLEISDILAVHTTSPSESVNTYATISRVVKDVTVGGVILRASTAQLSTQFIPDVPAPPAGSPLAYYYPEEREPTYRRIVLSKSAAAVRIMFRKASIRVSSMSDFIPLQSRAAVTCMVRSFEYYRSKDPNSMQMAKSAEDKAVSLLQEEQKSRNAFAELTSGEKIPIVGLGINNRDSIIVADIYDDACDISGKVGREAVFDKITGAVEMLSHKGQWDGNGLEGYVDITSANGVVTLPRYVDYVLAINIGTRPARMRNKWFEFHLNGPGSECSESCYTWTDLGDVVTLADLSEAQGLVYKTDSSDDNGKTLTVYGYDANDQWITFTVTGGDTFGFANISASKIKRIERITRDATKGYAQLTAFNSTGLISTQLGYYFPDETEPNYRRIRVPSCNCYVRLRYRKRQFLITALTDPLHLHSRLAILSAMRSVESLTGDKPNVQLAEFYEKKAIQYLADEKTSRSPGDVFHLQFDSSVSMSSPEHDQY